jgi:DNA-binding CsgD family transcriptional regulator
MIDVVRLRQQPMRMPTVPTLRFTPRGKEVFLLILEGFTRSQIAERLCMSVDGVRKHREKMLEQNGCKSRLELIAKYYGMDVEDGEDLEEKQPQE